MVCCKIRSELVTDMSYKAVLSWHAVNNTTMSYEVVLSWNVRIGGWLEMMKICCIETIIIICRNILTKHVNNINQ